MQAARGASLNPSDEDSTPETIPDPAVPSRSRLIVLFAAVAAFLYTLDVVGKVWAVRHLTPGETVDLVGRYFGLHLTRNPGAAFSTGTAYTEVLSVLSITAICAVLWVSRRLGSRLWAVGLGALLAGVAGNLTDRLFREPGFLHGHVVDYLRFPHWPIFNIADICINVAAAIIIIQALRGIGVDGRRVARNEE
ncbi:signal peptidase II [Nocardioides guangzhouensis]|uniref:signal peptidase II n=1 Tax=Nocardioides guangzhouensis TaxID=2497878 RepID=UPI001FE79D86|nr:signal peptidase II [Nocardioides guangzhouensis]